MLKALFQRSQNFSKIHWVKFYNFSKIFNFDTLISGLKEKKQDKISILSGAGISVAAGIPDFRTPKTGLYDNLQKQNLPQAEAIFDINYYSQNPRPFHQYVLDTFTHFKPTKAHQFIKLLNKRNQLLINFTQNIDGLEHKAGIDENKLLECHGNFRSAKCITCGKQGDLQIFIMKIKSNENYYCNCGSLIKPDIVFFGEALPSKFFQKIPLLQKADLAFIIGCSLTVYPFANLVNSFNENCEFIIMNKDQIEINIKNEILFLKGDIEKNVEEIINSCGFEKDIEELMKN